MPQSSKCHTVLYDCTSTVTKGRFVPMIHPGYARG